VGPPLLIYLFRDYGRLVHKGIHVVWILLFLVGVASTYFHATLSLMGQLFDELTILWVYSCTMIFFCPRRYLPELLKRRFSSFMLAATAIATTLSVWNPAINAFALMLLTIPTIFMLCNELERLKFKDSKVVALGIRTLILLTCAIVAWLNDRLLCDFYTSIRVTYLHAVWHVLIFLSSYCLCVLFAYFFVESERPNVRFSLEYWPSKSLQFTGIPYIAIHRKSYHD